jgi:hypothetical protein
MLSTAVEGAVRVHRLCGVTMPRFWSSPADHVIVGE